MPHVIDHIVIGAADLAAGVHALRAKLGVELPAGGKHPAMSTHNRLAQGGQGRFVEIIAIDPDAPPPRRRRWFTLDEPATRARLQERPRALCWVAGCDDLDGLVADSPVELGEITTLTRGDLSWRLTVPRDGSLPAGGLLPAFIEWPKGRHPSADMADLGLGLRAVHLSHPDPPELRATLRALRIDHLAQVRCGPRALSFELASPNGIVTLD